MTAIERPVWTLLVKSSAPVRDAACQAFLDWSNQRTSPSGGENLSLSANPAADADAGARGLCDHGSVCRLGPGLMGNALERLATTVRIKTWLRRALEVPLPSLVPRRDNVSLSWRFWSRFLWVEVAVEGREGVLFWRLTPPKTVSPPLTKVKWLKYSCSEMWLACHTLKMPY